MVVGSLLVCLRLEGAETIKDKRRIVRGLVEKLRQRFGVAAAEVGDLGLIGNATIGIATVSANAAQVEAMLAQALEFVEAHAEVEVYDLERRIDP